MSSLNKLRVLSLCLSIIFLCFNYGISGLVTGTLIATSRGLIPVEKLNIGDKVLSYDISTQNPEDAIFEVAITKIDKHLADTIFGIITENENWLDVSPQQLFFTLNPADAQSGNTAVVDFVQAQYLTIKDMLIDINMSGIPIVEIHKTELNGTPAQQYSDKIKKNKHNKVVAVEERMVKVDVYSIEVEEPHTFLVADKSYLVKNENHHLFIAHNGLPVLGVGLSFAFGSTPASVSFAEATLTAGGIGAKFGPTGVALGIATGLGIWGYQYFFGDEKKGGIFYLERAGQKKESSTDGKNAPKCKDKETDAQAPGKPAKEDGYVPPKRWDGKKVKHPKTGQHGWPDDKGKVWVPTGPGALAHGGPHWDVIDKGGDHINVMPGGKIRGTK